MLTSLPPGYNGVPASLVISTDMTRAAYVVYRNPAEVEVPGSGRAFIHEGCGVVLDRQEGRTYEYSEVDCLTFSPDSSSFCYVGKRKSGSAFVFNGVAHNFPGSIPYCPVLSRDGKRFGYVGRRGSDEKYVMIIDGVEHGPYESISGKEDGSAPLLFNHDGTRWAFSAEGDAGEYVVLDGAAHGPYKAVYGCVFSDDGRHFAYQANRNGKWSVVFDGNAYGSHDEIMDLKLSARRGRFAFSARDCSKDGKTTTFSVIADGQLLASYQGTSGCEPSHLTFCPDGKRIGYFSCVSGRVCTFVDGKETSCHDLSGADERPGVVYAFDPFRDILVYATCGGYATRSSVVLNGRVLGSSAEGHSLIAVSADGTSVAFVADDDGEERLMVNESEKWRERDGIEDFALSPDGRRTAVTASLGLRLVVDGIDSGAKWGISPQSMTFSPDSRHLVYVGWHDRDTSFVVVDGKRGPRFERILRGPEFVAERSFRYVASKSARVFLVEERLP